MAITIHTTVGSSIANSYISLQEAQDIIDGLIEDDDVVAWASSTTDQKNRAYFFVTKMSNLVTTTSKGIGPV